MKRADVKPCFATISSPPNMPERCARTWGLWIRLPMVTVHVTFSNRCSDSVHATVATGKVSSPAAARLRESAMHDRSQISVAHVHIHTMGTALHMRLRVHVHSHHWISFGTNLAGGCAGTSRTNAARCAGTVSLVRTLRERWSGNKAGLGIDLQAQRYESRLRSHQSVCDVHCMGP